MSVTVLGIRHHGPGSATAVLAELERIQPDAVLIEGPVDADPLISQVTADGMAPPVAILAYADDDPAHAAFWPFATFSPEWQALTWALTRGVDVGFCDVPAAMTLADEQRPGPDDASDERQVVRSDPIAALAAAAGYDDPERWWDDVIESRGEGGGFAAITEAMSALREDDASPRDTGEPFREQRREAHMRQVVRAAARRTERVVVVCGAWHTPALAIDATRGSRGRVPTASADAATLRGAAKRKVRLAWVPWTHSRLSTASGYGAGVRSPGWYDHLFTTPDHVIERWLTRVAHLLRDKDIPVSSAHIIESVRLSDTLATLRRRPLAGLAEVTDAAHAVMCDGSDVLIDLVWKDLVVGERLGTTPPDAPTVPLAADLRRSAKSLRLKLDPLVRPITLDLRKPADRDKSRLLHRLRALDIDWGTPEQTRGTGTFKEGWQLAWQPDFEVAVVVASLWGTTVKAAAGSRLADLAARSDSLAAVTGALEAALLADLPDAISSILATLTNAAAVDRDVEHLMAALPALARAMRYGDVRGTDTAALAQVAHSLLARVIAGLPAAVGSLDDDAATAMRNKLDSVNDVTSLLPEPDRQAWARMLRGLVDRSDVNGIVTGRIVRILLDAGDIDSADAGLRLHRALSVGAVPAAQAGWIDGFLSSGGLLLVHDNALLSVLDTWLTALPDDRFTDVVPLLRRTFGGFEPAVRRNIGDAVRDLDGSGTPPVAQSTLDPARAAAAVRTVLQIWGLQDA